MRDDGGVGPKTAPAESIADDDGARTTFTQLIGRGQSADLRVDAQRLEESLRDMSRPQPLGWTEPRQIGAALLRGIPVSAQLCEVALGAPPVVEIGNRHGSAICSASRVNWPHADEVFLSREGEWAKEDLLDDAENGRGGTDPQRERGDRHDRKRRGRSEHADGVPRVVHHPLPPLATAGLGKLSAIQCEHGNPRSVDVAELPPGLGTGGLGSHALPDQLLDPHGEMARDLGVHVIRDGGRLSFEAEEPTESSRHEAHAVRTTRDTAAEYRSQTDTRTCSCFWPAGVSS
jgi:hypothetical protein